MPTTYRRSPHTPDEFGTYLDSAAKAAFRRARAAGRTTDDAADISQDVAEYVLHRGPAILADYPSPELFAAVRVFHATVAWDRRNGAQSGSGAAFGRSRVCLDAEFGPGPRLREELASNDDTAYSATQNVLGDAIRLAVAANLDPRTARWVWDVKGDGLTVADVARRDGVARETVSRAVNAAVRQLQRVLGEFLGG